MTKTILGIDPGMSGALAFYDEGELLIYDMPTFEITKGKGKRKRLDISLLIQILKSNEYDHAVIEKVSAQPTNGAAAAFTFGWGCGAVEALVQSQGQPFSYVTSMKWKKDTMTPKDKDGARMRASQLMPQFAHNWQRKKDDGRAEAALIAYWGMRNVYGL